MSPKSFARFACLLFTSLALPHPAGAVTPNGRLQIIHMDVGQGDGTVLITPFGQVVLIDNGVYNNTSAPVNQLAALGVTHVDLHFASHYHADHIGAISQIVNSGVVIDAGWDRAESYNSGTYTTYVNTLGAKRHTLVKDQVFTLDVPSAHPVTIKCVNLRGAGQTVSDENAKCVVLKVSYGEYDQVFGGDLTGTSSNGGDIESIVGPQVGPVEVYKVHHHGSRYSSNNNWLNATTPKIGVIQVGNGNGYGHPTADALSRLHAHGVRTYWNETGAGVAPNPAWDKVANGQVIIQATWEPGGIDTVRAAAWADTFTNSGTPALAAVEPRSAQGLALALPAPNPSSSDVTLGFTLPVRGDARLEVLDLAGRRSWSWEGLDLNAGSHAVRWNGLDHTGAHAPVGVYWVRLSAAGGARVAKLARVQ